MQHWLLAAATYGDETAQLAAPAWQPYVVGGMAVLIMFALIALAIAVWSLKGDLRALAAKLDANHAATKEECEVCREKVWTEINVLRNRLTSLEARK